MILRVAETWNAWWGEGEGGWRWSWKGRLRPAWHSGLIPQEPAEVLRKSKDGQSHRLEQPSRPHCKGFIEEGEAGDRDSDGQLAVAWLGGQEMVRPELGQWQWRERRPLCKQSAGE